MRRRVAAIWVLALAAGAASLVLRRPPAPPLVLSVDGAVEVRAAAPDLVHDALVGDVHLVVRPPWTRGASVEGALVVTPEAMLPRPLGLFSPVPAPSKGWRAWEGPGSERGTGGRRELADLLGEARVSITSEEGTLRACDRWVFGRWVCGPNAWNWVGPAQVRVRGRQRSCVWMHPSDEGAVRVELGAFAGGSQLRGHIMLDDAAVTDEQAGPVTLTLLADGRRFASRDQADRVGTTTIRERIPSSDEPVAFALEVQAESTGRRHFCVELSILEPTEDP